MLNAMALLSRTTYADLFSEIGTAFGAGDGSTHLTFQICVASLSVVGTTARGVDSGRSFAASQGDQNKQHNHSHFSRYRLGVFTTTVFLVMTT